MHSMKGKYARFTSQTQPTGLFYLPGVEPCKVKQAEKAHSRRQDVDDSPFLNDTGEFYGMGLEKCSEGLHGNGGECQMKS